jgi:hypothetical protein
MEEGLRGVKRGAGRKSRRMRTVETPRTPRAKNGNYGGMIITFGWEGRPHTHLPAVAADKASQNHWRKEVSGITNLRDVQATQEEE